MTLEFNISKDDFLKALSNQQNITSRKKTLAILSNVLIEADKKEIIITGTDLSICLKETVSAEVKNPGSITLPARKLYEILKESPSQEISVKEDDNCWIKIKSGKSVYKLAGISREEFPEFPEYEEKNLAKINSDVFSVLIDKTIYSIANEQESMFTLTAALLKKIKVKEKSFLQMVSSDGHRLSIMTKELENSLDNFDFDKFILIPKSGVKEIQSFSEERSSFFIGVEEKQIILKDERSVLIIRLQDGEFPDFNSVIESMEKGNIMKINRLLFLESLKRINLFTEDLFHAISMDISKNKMILTSKNSDYGSAKDEIEIDYQGEPFVIGFNCRYFIDALQVMEGEVIEADIKSSETPCLLTSEDDEGFLSIIMPVKL